MRKIIILFVLSSICSFAFGDTVALEDFLSEQVYKGAIPCEKVLKNGEEQVTAYAVPEAKAKITEPQKIKLSCAAGGGDCLCFVLFTESAPGYLRVYNQDKTKQFWIAGLPSDSVSMETMLRPEGNEIRLRTPAPSLYSEKDLKKSVYLKDIIVIPASLKTSIQKDYRLPEGLLTVPTPRPDSNATMFVSSLSKNIALKEYKLPEFMNLIVDSSTSLPREIQVYAKLGNRYLIVTDYFDQSPNYSSIHTGRYAFWAEFKNTPVNFGAKNVNFEDSLLFSGINYKLIEIQTVNGRSVAHLELSVKMDRILRNAESPDDEGAQLFKLNDVWIPVKDEKGRLNFFLIYNEGC